MSSGRPGGAGPLATLGEGVGIAFSALGANKLRAGFLRALEKRPVSVERIEAVINHIKHALRATGEREVGSRVLGELVMDQLKQLDQVAYVRFASVYRSFEDISEFRDTIERLEAEPAGKPAR